MKKNLKKIILTLIGIFLITSGFSCKLFPTKKVAEKLSQDIKLTFWGVWDETDDWQEVIADFNKLHPNISITYRKFRYQEYEQKLLEGWAEDRGPDLYLIPVEWLRKYQNRITPQPAKVELAFQEVKKTLGKTEINTIVRQVPIYKLNDIKNLFVETVFNDVIIDGKIYGLPLSVDTLALIYNRDLLDAAGVATPPANWTELKEAVKKVTILDQQNNLIQAGVALGTAYNIPRAVDIASLLMMQNGAPMISGNQINFSGAGKSPVGLEALKFYTDFADPIKEVYSWNEEQPNALEAFIAGKVAMIYGYSYQLPTIKGRAPKLNFSLAPMTQIQGASQPVNFANYWVATVAHKVKNIDAAWGFLNFAASESVVKKYLAKTKRPAALRSLLVTQKEDPELAVFVDQTLTASHWYRGQDPLKMEEYFLEMIAGLPKINDPKELADFFKLSAEKISQTL